MARTIDLASVSPERAARLLAGRASKARAYQRRREELLARNKSWQELNQEKSKEIAASWRARNSDLLAKKKRDWYDKNRDLQLSRAKAANANLVDSVVRSRFARDSGLQSHDVPDEMIATLRLSMQITRKIKELRK